jgi:hypothetical protein
MVISRVIYLLRLKITVKSDKFLTFLPYPKRLPKPSTEIPFPLRVSSIILSKLLLQRSEDPFARTAHNRTFITPNYVFPLIEILDNMLLLISSLLHVHVLPSPTACCTFVVPKFPQNFSGVAQDFAPFQGTFPANFSHVGSGRDTLNISGPC